MKKVLIAFALIGTLHAQTGPSYFNAPAILGLVSSTGASPFAPMATSGSSGPSYDNAQPMLLLGYNSTTGKYYVCGTANPCVSGSGGGGTIPSTTNLLAGDGAGNAADSAIAPSNVATLSGAQTVSGLKTFSAGGNFNDKTSVASSAATATTSTFTVTDNEASATNMFGAKLLAPNMGNNTNFFFELGNNETSIHSVFLGFHLEGSSTRFFIQPYGVSTALSVFTSSQNVNIGAATTDSGYKLDVQGSFRASQMAGSGTAPTIAAGTGAGTSPTVSLTGTASAFTVNVTTGTTSASSAVIATVTFPTAYSNAPRVVCQAKNAATAAANTTVFVTETTTTAVLNAGATALTDSTAYSWDCHTIQ